MPQPGRERVERERPLGLAQRGFPLRRVPQRMGRGHADVGRAGHEPLGRPELLERLFVRGLADQHRLGAGDVRQRIAFCLIGAARSPARIAGSELEKAE